MHRQSGICTLALAALLIVAASQASAQRAPVTKVDASDMLPEERFRSALQTLHDVEAYNRYLETLIADQQRAGSAVRVATDNLATVKLGIVPHLTRMIDELEAFVALDLPFLADERQQRIASLRAMMARASVSLAEKYRRILEAYQVEMGYGREVEAYAGWLEGQGTRREVDFLRIGRLVLTYQTRDRGEAGFWNAQASPPGWQPLGDEYRAEIARGLRLARRQAPPEWLTLPVPAPVEVASR